MDIAVLTLIPLYIFYMLYLSVLMFKRRTAAVKRGDIEHTYFKDYQGTVPEDVAVIGNHFNNQFQVPMIFFITAVAAVALKSNSMAVTICLYAFVASRLLHSYIHLVGNKLLKRAKVYALGILLLLVAWGLIIFNFIASPT